MTKQVNVPKLRFGDFDGNWHHYSIKETISALVDCEHKTAPYVDAQDYMVVRTNNIKNGSLLMDDMKYTSKEGFDEWTKRAVPSYGDILFTREAPAGESCLVPKDTNLCLGQRMVLLQIDQSVMNSVFISQLLLSPKVQNTINSYCIGSTVTRINIADINRIDFDIPTLPEQQKIASFLSKVDEKIALLTEKKNKLTEYKKGVMQQLFNGKWESQDGQLTFIPPTLRFKADDGSEFPDWEEQNYYDLLNEVIDFRGRTPLKLGMDWGNGSILSLSANNVKNGYIDLNAENNLGSNALYEKWMGKVNLSKGDIVFTMEAPLGNALLLPDDKKYILSQRVVAFKTKSEIVQNKFLIQVIWSEAFQSNLSRLSTGTTAKGINQKSLRKVKLSLPSLSEQTKIANFLSAIDNKVELADSELEKAKEWKRGLLQQMFV